MDEHKLGDASHSCVKLSSRFVSVRGGFRYGPVASLRASGCELWTALWIHGHIADRSTQRGRSGTHATVCHCAECALAVTGSLDSSYSSRGHRPDPACGRAAMVCLLRSPPGVTARPGEP